MSENEEYDSYFELLKLMVSGGENMKKEKIVYDPNIEKQGMKPEKEKEEKQKKAEREARKAEEKTKREAEKKAKKAKEKAESEKQKEEASKTRNVIMSWETPLISMPPFIRQKAGLEKGVKVHVDWDETQQVIIVKVIGKEKQ